MENKLMTQNNSIQGVDPAAVAAGELAKSRLQSGYTMAIQNPRNEDQARVLLLEACKRPTFAAQTEYSKPVGGITIKGPSIRFAEVALRVWRNVFTETQVVFEDEKLRRIKVILTDLESNTSYSKEIQISKTVERKNEKGRDVIGERINSYGDTVYIVVATDDEMQTKESALISKVVRNEGLRLIPGDIIEEAMETARQTINKRDKADPDAAKKKLIDAFFELGVKPIDLEKYLKHPIASISPAELEDLRGVHSALKEGTSFSSFLEPVKTDEDSSGKTKSKEIESKPATEGQIKKIRESLEAKSVDGQHLLDEFKIKTLELLPKSKVPEALSLINKLAG